MSRREVGEVFHGAVEGAEEERKEKPWKTEKPEHEMTKAEKKKARRQAEKAEAQAARAKGEVVPSFGKKRKRGSDVGQTPSEASGPSAASEKVEADINDPTQYQSARSHELSQKPLQAEVGDRDPAGVDREDAVKVPVVVEHDAQGDVKVPETSSKKRKAGEEDDEAEKERQKLAKKAKRAEKKARKAKKEGGEDVEMIDAAPPTPAPAPAVAPPSTVKKEGNEAAKQSRKAKRGSKGADALTNGTPAKVKPEDLDDGAPVANGTPAAAEEKVNIKKEDTDDAAQMNGIPSIEKPSKKKKKAKKTKIKEEESS
jgi:hypothetical protein